MNRPLDTGCLHFIPLKDNLRGISTVIFLQILRYYLWPHVGTRVYIFNGSGVFTRVYFRWFLLTLSIEKIMQKWRNKI